MAHENNKVYCNGTNEEKSNASLGHPGVFLKIPPNTNSVACPYCGHVFKLPQKAPKRKK